MLVSVLKPLHICGTCTPTSEVILFRLLIFTALFNSQLSICEIVCISKVLTYQPGDKVLLLTTHHIRRQQAFLLCEYLFLLVAVKSRWTPAPSRPGTDELKKPEINAYFDSSNIVSHRNINKSNF